MRRTDLKKVVEVHASGAVYVDLVNELRDLRLLDIEAQRSHHDLCMREASMIVDAEDDLELVVVDRATLVDVKEFKRLHELFFLVF